MSAWSSCSGTSITTRGRASVRHSRSACARPTPSTRPWRTPGWCSRHDRVLLGAVRGTVQCADALMHPALWQEVGAVPPAPAEPCLPGRAGRPAPRLAMMSRGPDPPGNSDAAAAGRAIAFAAHRAARSLARRGRRQPPGDRPAAVRALGGRPRPDHHASRLARHTAGLAEGAPFDALVHEPVTGDVDPLQVRRVTLRGDVRALAEHDAARAADRASYLAKFPEAEPITALGDFAFFRLEITGGRLVSGFGGANQPDRSYPARAARRQSAVLIVDRLSMIACLCLLDPDVAYKVSTRYGRPFAWRMRWVPILGPGARLLRALSSDMGFVGTCTRS